MKHYQFTKANVVTVLIAIQDCGDVRANQIATKAVGAFGLEELHERLTAQRDAYLSKSYCPKR